MELSRRHVLSLVPAAGLLALARPVPASADPATDLARLKTNTIEVFAGTASSNARQEVAPKLAAIVQAARARLADMDAAGEGELFAGLPLGTSDANLNRAFQNLYEIALATRAPGSALFGDSAVRQRVLDGLEWLHESYYGDQSAGYYGNWFNWEIGISTSASKALLLLDAPADLVSTYVASMDAYLRNGKDGDVDLDSRFHTGANLADITTNRILQGALLGAEARVTKAVADQRTVFATVDPYDLQHGVTDGYYADGSFIQHHSVAYTGSYGRALLTRVVQAVKILDGTAYAGDAALVEVVRGWVVDGFAPLIFEGWLMEVVKGRAVSRSTAGYGDVASIVEAIVDLADYVSDPVPLKGYVKFLRVADASVFVSPVSVQRYFDVLASPVPAADLNPPSRSVAFNAMDRTVHRRPGYAFAVARSSSRISKYEYMNGENLMPWFQGDGAHYLYLSGQDQSDSFGVDYYTTVSPYRLSGVTTLPEERQTVPDLYGRFWYENPAAGFTSSSSLQNKYVYFPCGTNEFSGGATLGAYGVAGMVLSDDVPYVDKQAGLLPDDFVAYPNARATKSWFLFDDEVVVLAAGVSPDAVTTVDSRIAAADDDVVVTGSREWLRWANRTSGASVGYVFLSGRPEVEQAVVTRSQRVVRVSNPDTAVTKRVVSVVVRGTCAFALVPNASEGAVRTSARVVANTPAVQAVSHRGLVGVNAFGGGWQRAGWVSVHGPGSVLVRRSPDRTVTVAVSDPTMGQESVSVVLRGAFRVVSADEGVEVRRVAGGTLVRVRTWRAYGRTFSAVLR
ncbi:polysaccharide lyase family 8 super-sandwich domain-containing protein [Actinophytocola algeriensis]|uniref:Hyaluronate lyase n=1 Tax=Actinophytocola algeriensis TaxID=1768010 RepID=A0A7W7VGP0_9PSEU|nr:polysaccharide lyase family 8 super-sandwich domain-containing protein [Actinophytocola algeriensis]MBB4909571.1 hyaluronate lyase [Actinophytocola algeriensis]MBE1475561.1 hyaluronate lyase [Actinophytocola algeriensis]